MENDRRKTDMKTVLDAFMAHAEEDRVTEKEIKGEIVKVKEIHDQDQLTRREFEGTVNHVLFGNKKLGGQGMRDKVDELHARQVVQITQNADILRALRGDELTGEVGLIKKLEEQEKRMSPVLDAWKATKWLFGTILAFATLLGAITVIKKFFPNL